MKSFIKNLKKYTRSFLWFFVFFITAVMLYFILPGEPRFKYEYQKGFPWNHKNLVAPFDFAILKSPAEFDEEKNELLKSVVPYFIFDTTIVHHKTEQFITDWNTTVDTTNYLHYTIRNKIIEKINSLYSSGILIRSPESYEELANTTEINKRAGNLILKSEKELLLSEKSAYNALNNTFINLAKQYHQSAKNILLLKPEKYITSNLEYDNLTTQKERNEIEKDISTTRGMVKTGERIIVEGEIITNEKFQILESLKAGYKSGQGQGINKYLISIGKGFLIVIFLILLFTFLYVYRYDILEQFSKLSFLLICMVSIIGITIFIDTFPNLSIYLVPFAIFPIVIRTFFDSRTAIFTLTITTLLTGFYAPNNYEFVLLQIAAGIVAVFSLNKMHRRSHLIMAAFWVFLTYTLLYTALELIFEGDILSINFKTIQWFALSCILILLVYPLVFVFEKMFGFVSDVTLIELSDSNQPLLRQLAEKAPGTFQHSLQIANLAEEIILKIGGNPFLVRAGALYHDIGKVARPEFFIENQALGINPHDKLNHLKSAEVIIDHVKNGVKLAKKHNLPEALIEFIATHHGTTKAKYFYLKHIEENNGEKIDEAPFIYPGPLPRTKEAAVVMITDGIEAASRSLKQKTMENLKDLINNMIDQKINEKQLENSNLTFRDINIIKNTLLEKLINIYHVRIEYPKEKNQ